MNDGGKAVKKRRKIRFSHVLIGLLLAAVAAFAIFRVSTKFKLKARIDAVYAAGYPVTCAELDQWYAIPPDAENAAYVMEVAFESLHEWEGDKKRSLPLFGKAQLPARTEPLSPEMKAVIAEFVADNNEALDLLHEAAEIEDCRYPIDLNAGLATLSPNLSQMRGAVRLLELEGILHAENGDRESAMRSVMSGFGIARSLAREPLTISQLVRAACQATAILTIEQVINRTELTDGQLAQLVECVRASERVSDMSCAFVGERCMGISFFRAPESVGFSSNGSAVLVKPLLAIYKALGLADADAAIYLDLMDGHLKAAQLPLHERLDAVNAVEAKFQATSKAHILLRQIMPALARVTTIETRAIAHLRAAQVGLAIQRYRLAADELPATLADLAPTYLETVPKDPFDGNELRYRKLEPGFVVYSIGEDLSDDGGKEKPSKTVRGGKPVKWDVTFIVKR
ncbi:MAG: hypothetical protein ACYTBS_23835 [Planctomycetota bacterium]|jgi:hypothetical protein